MGVEPGAHMILTVRMDGADSQPASWERQRRADGEVDVLEDDEIGRHSQAGAQQEHQGGPNVHKGQVSMY